MKLFEVRASWSRDTSYEPDGWWDKSPALAQSAVTSLVLQVYLDGELLRAAAGGQTTYFWAMVDGEDLDLTLEQFDPVPIWTLGTEGRGP